MYEMTIQINGSCESVFFKDKEAALSEANAILNDKNGNPLDFVSVAECEMRDGEVYETAILLARRRMHGGN